MYILIIPLLAGIIINLALFIFGGPVLGIIGVVTFFFTAKAIREIE